MGWNVYKFVLPEKRLCLTYLFLTVFRYFAERIATASITFKEQDQETKHHYSNQRRLSGKGKPFTELIYAAMLNAVLKIGNMRCKSAVKPRLATG